jgi:hypothetical protein
MFNLQARHVAAVSCFALLVLGCSAAHAACGQDTRISDFAYDIEPELTCVDVALVGEVEQPGCSMVHVWLTNNCSTSIEFPNYDDLMECGPEVGDLESTSDCSSIAAGETGWVRLKLDSNPDGERHEVHYDIEAEQTAATLTLTFRGEKGHYSPPVEEEGCSISGVSSPTPSGLWMSMLILIAGVVAFRKTLYAA